MDLSAVVHNVMCVVWRHRYNHSGAYVEVHGNPVSDVEEEVKIYAAAGAGEAGSEWTSLGKGV